MRAAGIATARASQFGESHNMSFASATGLSRRTAARTLRFALFALALLLGASQAGRADQFAFSYAGGGVSGSGILIADLVGTGEW